MVLPSTSVSSGSSARSSGSVCAQTVTWRSGVVGGFSGPGSDGIWSQKEPRLIEIQLGDASAMRSRRATPAVAENASDDGCVSGIGAVDQGPGAGQDLVVGGVERRRRKGQRPPSPFVIQDFAPPRDLGTGSAIPKGGLWRATRKPHLRGGVATPFRLIELEAAAGLNVASSLGAVSACGETPAPGVRQALRTGHWMESGFASGPRIAARLARAKARAVARFRPAELVPPLPLPSPP
jgi:hypothetical protein